MGFTFELLKGVYVLVQIVLKRDTLERKEENIFNLEIPMHHLHFFSTLKSLGFNK